MKKLFFVFTLICLCVCAFADTITLANNNIKVDLFKNGSKVGIKQISGYGTDFLAEKESALWTLEVIKDREYGKENIVLKPGDSEVLSVVKNTGTNLILRWENVKTKDMTSGFDVTAKIWLKGENSYWNLSVSANKEYGLYAVAYPYIEALDAKNGDEIMWPIRGGKIYNKFDNPEGFELIQPCDLKYSQDIGFFGPGTMQIITFTKGNSSLYLCPEDPKGYVKTLNLTQKEANNIAYTPRYYATYAGIAGHAYQQPYPFNIAAVKGDWYDCAKKYRKWGEKSKIGVFANGKLEKRTDLPDWYKKNNIWFTYEGWFDKSTENMIKSAKILDMPAIAHIYHYSVYPFDTHYPNWLPAKENMPKEFAELQKNNIKVMPYTNGHLVDRALSDSYKKHGDDLVMINDAGDYYAEGWSAELGAKNVSGCPDSIYYDVYKNEAVNIMKTLNTDSLYVDQIGGMALFPCFNKNHSHTPAGCYMAEKYNSLIKDLREECSALKGESFPITTEDSSELFAFDGWLRINDGDPTLMDIPFNMFVSSDYVVNFGCFYDAEEIEKDFHSGINKTVIGLTRGYQLGWRLGAIGEFEKNPEFADHFRKTAKARDSHVEYFNFGEMVRPVTITSDIPVKNLYYFFHSALPENRGNYDFPMVRTCSFNYKGKTMVCFSNAGDEKVTVDWTAKAKDLNLKNKSSYTVTQTYAKDAERNEVFENKGKKGEIASTFDIYGRDTVIFIVE